MQSTFIYLSFYLFIYLLTAINPDNLLLLLCFLLVPVPSIFESYTKIIKFIYKLYVSSTHTPFFHVV